MVDVTQTLNRAAAFDLTQVPAHVCVIGVSLPLVPTFTSGCVQFQVFGWAFILGTIWI